MKYKYLVPLLLILIIAACGKDDDVLQPIYEEEEDFTYEISGFRDTMLERTGEVFYNIYVEKKSGKGEAVVLSAEDLPKGMSVRFEPAGIEASYYTNMYIRTERTPIGDYVINIKGAAPTGGVKNNPVNVAVTWYSNAAVGVAGEYTESRNCSQTGSGTNDVTVELDESGDNKLVIKGLLFGVMSTELNTIIDPTNRTLTIPQQVKGSVTYQGDGTYREDQISINYTVTGSTINESCTSTLTRKL